jgi:hypothetical protein
LLADQTRLWPLCAGLLASIVPLLAYGATLAPSITWRNGGIDSGDVATAAAVLGIGHPPGYALFVLLGHFAVRAAPWLEPARAVNWLCALLAAGTAGLAFRACIELILRLSPPGDSGASPPRRGAPAATQACKAAEVDPGPYLAALAATWAVSLGPLWWQQANLATVHSLNLLLAAGINLFAVRALTRGLARWEVPVVGLLLGLAVTHHLTLLAMPASIIVVVLATRGCRHLFATVGPREIGLGLAALVVGLLPWPALAVIAASAPPHQWGDPTTVAGLVDLVTARGYQDYVSRATPVSVAYRLAAGVWTGARALGLVGFPTALAGLALLWDVRRRYCLYVLTLAAITLGFFALYAARDVESYLLPAIVAAAPASAFALLLAGRSLASQVRWLNAIGWLGLFAILTAVGSLALNWSTMDLSRDRAALDYARGVLAEAPAGALIISDGDRETFALWYVRTALRERSDAAIVDRGLLHWPWYRALVGREYPDIGLPSDGVLVDSTRPGALTTTRPIVTRSADR